MFLISNRLYLNLYRTHVNYEVAKWLLSNYPGISVKNLPEMNNNKVKAQNYDTVAMLEQFSADSCFRTHNIWFLPNRFRNN